MDLYYLLSMIGGLSLLSNVIKYMIFFLFSLIIPYRYNIDSSNDRFLATEVCNYIDNNKFYSMFKTVTMKKKYPTQIVLGKGFICFIGISKDYNSSEPAITIQLFSLDDIIQKILDKNSGNKSLEKDVVEKEHINNNNLTVYYKAEAWISSEYEYKNINFNNNFTSDIQFRCVDYICESLDTAVKNGFNNSITVLITGKSGIGKSKIAYVLASKLNASLCEDFELTSPGYCLNSLLKVSNPSKNNPLVLLIDEYDIPIMKLYDNTITNHKTYRSPIIDKNSNNKFMDNLCINDNLITILTSNKDYQWFKDKDLSVVRPGRINIHINLDEKEPILTILSNDECLLASKINMSKFTKKYIKSE